MSFACVLASTVAMCGLGAALLGRHLIEREASVKITGDYYAHYRPGQKRRIMDGLDERVRQAAQ